MAIMRIPYGVDDFAFDDLSSAAPPFPCASIALGAKTPLRLNSTRFDENLLARLRGSDDPLGLIRAALVRLCSPWDKLSRRFVELYFDCILARLETHREAIAKKLLPFDGLYRAEDFVYSALMPLPRAHLYAPCEPGALKRQDFVAVECAFWLGDRLIAATTAPSALTPRKAREKMERLAGAGIEATAFGPQDLEGSGEALLARLLSEDHLSFWTGESVPCGPLRPAALD